MTHHARTLACVAVLGVAGTAQHYTAHPIDNSTSTAGQVIPFGIGTPNFDEARSQFLFPSPYLPSTGGLLTGIELVSSSSITGPYERFEIWMDHSPNTVLSSTFAANLTNPTLVFSRSPGTITWNGRVTGGVWDTLTLDAPFVYDGASSLVVEVRKVVDRPNLPVALGSGHHVLVYPLRSDLQTPIWAYGLYGSGAVDAATATTTYRTQFRMRLVWGQSPTLTIDSTRDTTVHPHRAYYHLGATTTITAQGQPGEAFALAVGLSLLQSGATIPTYRGELWIGPTFLVIASGTIEDTNRTSVALTIPTDARLIGLMAYFQAVTVGQSVSWTNVVDAPLAAY